MEAQRWRAYGMALATVKAYPQAIQALHRALQLAPGDAETRLCLGRVYQEEGDLLAAREQFAQASGLGDRARAWEASILRLMGQPEQAAARLELLVRRYPRDRRLRFELGKSYMAQLRNEEAAREFGALLAVDPADLGGHYNRMLCLQRLNRLAEARREEAMYRLLAEEAAPALPGGGRRAQRLEDRPLHVHSLKER